MKYSLSEIIIIVFSLATGIITFLATIYILLSVSKHWKTLSLKRKLIHLYSGFLIWGVAWLFGGIFFIEGFLLGGTYLNGKIENEQYYLGRGHGYYTKVSKKLYTTVETLDKTFVIYCILCVISIPIIQFSVKDANKIMLEEDDNKTE